MIVTNGNCNLCHLYTRGETDTVASTHFVDRYNSEHMVHEHQILDEIKKYD